MYTSTQTVITELYPLTLIVAGNSQTVRCFIEADCTGTELTDTTDERSCCLSERGVAYMNGGSCTLCNGLWRVL